MSIQTTWQRLSQRLTRRMPVLAAALIVIGAVGQSSAQAPAALAQTPLNPYSVGYSYPYSSPYVGYGYTLRYTYSSDGYNYGWPSSFSSGYNYGWPSSYNHGYNYGWPSFYSFYSPGAVANPATASVSWQFCRNSGGGGSWVQTHGQPVVC